MKLIYNITLFLFLLPTIVLASTIIEKKKHEKSKKISKNFSVNKDATLFIKNKYGNVNVTTWNKNTVQIDISITVKGNSLDKVEDKLKSIYIEFNNNSSMVEATTRFGEKRSSWWSWGNNNNINYEINYNIKMPITNNANLNNDYGTISLDKLEGEATINCDYGKIIIGDLLGNNSNINLDYCKNSTISFMKNGNINVDYSSIRIDKSRDVKVNSDYSTLKFESSNSIIFKTDYGSISAEDVVSISGNGDYTGIKIGTLRKDLKINSDYGQLKIEKLDKGFESVYIDSEFASIKIGFTKDVSFDFVVELQYAGFKKEGNFEIMKSIEKNTKKYFEGTYNKGGKGTVKIKSQYGSVGFYEK